MSDSFFIIAFTSPGHIYDESYKICDIIDKGKADIVHIRKPEWTIEQTESLIEMIPVRYHNNLKIHDHFSLLHRFDLLGVHLNTRNPVAPAIAKSVSCSFHSIEQLKLATHYDYVTLSPIYDSISKIGYRSAFSLSELKPFLHGKRIVALGGVTPDRIQELKDVGFAGAAMLGYFWNK